jgi:putative DNA primase/helicase
MLISNEVPNLNDSGGVLPGRFIKVRFDVSFEGREDVELRSKLERELPGIAVRCVRAYQRLNERGYFVQPETAEVLELEVRAASDPFVEMALECFVRDPHGTVVKAQAYEVFDKWCRKHGQFELLRKTRDNQFGNRLMAVPGFEKIFPCRPRLRDGSLGPRCWGGMSVKDVVEEILNAP